MGKVWIGHSCNEDSMDPNPMDMAHPMQKGTRTLFVLSCCSIPCAHRKVD